MIDRETRTGDRPARVAWWIGLLLVAAITVASAAGVVRAVDQRTVYYSGALDVEAVAAQNVPSKKLRARQKARGAQTLASARAEVERPRADGRLLAAWSAVRMAWPLVAVLAFLLLSPVLRAAGRGDPFAVPAEGRLWRTGWLLLLAYPIIVAADAAVDLAATGEYPVFPMVSPSAQFQVYGFLPGLLLLALAAVFRSGSDLRRFEQETV